jgi:hypothetical protein
MTTLLCDDCEHVCEEEDLKVRYPNIAGLLERINPGEPVPYGECPECGALMHRITPKPGLRAWLTINDGKFEAQCPLQCGGEPDLVTDDPEEIRAFFKKHRPADIMKSSSVDFPEEYGMPQAKVDQLFGR